MIAQSPVATPVIKWVGGKTKLLPELVSRLPDKMGRYFEPFAGGAALFFRLAPKEAVLADVNPDLINLYNAIANDTPAVMKRLREHRRRHTKSHYHAVRERWNCSSSRYTSASSAAAFLYLNKTCFNGLWRVNRRGDFNVPMGRYCRPQIYTPENLRIASRLLSRADLRCTHYQNAVSDAERGDFVYFDPPYDPVSKTSTFTSYAVGGFTPADQVALAKTARELVDRGCKVMLSNSDTPFIRSIYRGFRIDRVMCGRSINSNAAKRGGVAEVIITGGYRPRARSS